MESITHTFAQTIDYLSEIRAPYNADGARPSKGLVEKKVTEFHELIRSPAFTWSDLPAYLDALKNVSTVGLDDRELLLEKVLVLMSRLQHTELSMKIQQSVIDLLYNDLPHPPVNYLAVPSSALQTITPSRSVKYAFRSADGSNYNPLSPSLGKAGSPYARSVPSINCTSPHTLPDPGLVFDALLRREKFVPHPGGVSSLFFAFADLVIHSIFNTNHTDWTINDASSYLDLSILYGSSQSQVDQVRRKDGTGKLWEDVFADSRLLFMPPASCALLVLLSRNHNYIAQKILDINESGTFVSRSADELARLAQDDEIFHRARLVNCGYFMQIILGDYVGTILGLVRDECDWRLNPLMPMRELNHAVSPRGEGNLVSVEFNLLYRWHSTLSQKDAAWTAQMFDKIFEGKDSTKITTNDFKLAAHTHMVPPKDIRKWTFGELTRDSNGRFKDDDLAKLLQDATECRAGAFRARGIPETLRVIEIMGIEQARSWGTCSLNEFRKFLGLRPYSSFEEWNNDPEIHTVAASLYKDIENLELHVGLQAEQAKIPGPGAGLCPGYTISRAILADAVSLTRGDRFLTLDFTPFNLTAWGYQDCQYDTKDGSYGGLLTKLLFRTLPDHYPVRSAYAHFPFLDPTYMKENFSKKQDLVHKYIWTRPPRPIATVSVNTYSGVKQVLGDPEFMSAYDDQLLNIMSDVLVPEGSDYDFARKALLQGKYEVEKLFLFSVSDRTSAEYFKKKTGALIEEKIASHVGKTKYVDVVHEVINILPVHWISEVIAGLPLKSKTNPNGAWYEQDVYTMFADVGRYIFLDFDPADNWHLRESSIVTYNQVTRFIEDHLQGIDSLVSIPDSLDHQGINSYQCHEFLKRVQVARKNNSHKELAAYVFATVVPTAAPFSQAIAHVVDFYLKDENLQARGEILKLAASQDEAATSRIMTYVHEALRINPPVWGVYRTATKDATVGLITVQAKDRIFASVVDANHDVRVFGSTATTAGYDRPTGRAGILGIGEHGLLATKFFESVVPTILATILGLNNVQRAPGQAGQFAKFVEPWGDSQRQLFVNSRGKVTPFPDSLLVQFN